MVSTPLIQIDAPKEILPQEKRFTLDGFIFGYGIQQPKKYTSHTSDFSLEY